MTVPIDKRIDPSNNRRNGSKARDAAGKKCSELPTFCWPEVEADAISKADACSMIVAPLMPLPEAPKCARTTRNEETRIITDIIVMPNLNELPDI